MLPGDRAITDCAVLVECRTVHRDDIAAFGNDKAGQFIGDGHSIGTRFKAGIGPECSGTFFRILPGTGTGHLGTTAVVAEALAGLGNFHGRDGGTAGAELSTNYGTAGYHGTTGGRAAAAAAGPAEEAGTAVGGCGEGDRRSGFLIGGIAAAAAGNDAVFRVGNRTGNRTAAATGFQGRQGGGTVAAAATDRQHVGRGGFGLVTDRAAGEIYVPSLGGVLAPGGGGPVVIRLQQMEEFFTVKHDGGIRFAIVDKRGKFVYRGEAPVTKARVVN